MARSDKPNSRRQAGFVDWNGFRAVCFDDGRWTVVKQGRSLPGVADALRVYYRDFRSFPFWPADEYLRDLSSRVGGRLTLNPRSRPPEGIAF